jgi:hypothetical protein
MKEESTKLNASDTYQEYIVNKINSISNNLEQDELSCSDCYWFENCESERIHMELDYNVCDDFYSIDTKLDDDEYIGRLIERGRQNYRDEFEEFMSEWE